MSEDEVHEARLGPRASAFRDHVVAEYELTETDRLILAELVRALDEADVLRAVVEDEGPVYVNGAGALVVNPAVTALNATRKTIELLSKRLGLDEDEKPSESWATKNARKAAQARWSGHRGTSA